MMFQEFYNMKPKFDFQQLQRLTSSRVGFSADDNISDTEPQKCDSPREILMKYARGQQIVSLGEYYEDEDYNEEQMEDTQILDDEFDRMDYLLEASLASKVSKKSPSEAEKVESGINTPSPEEMPDEG